MIPKKCLLNNGSIYWHKLYFDNVPKWMTKYSPPLGNYNYAAYLYQPQKYLIALYDRAKWFIQRGYRGYSDRDTWSIDWYLCEWMPAALATLKKRKIGHPFGESQKSWRAKIDRMINAFVLARKIQNYDYKTTEEMQTAMKQFRKDFNLVKTHFFDLWD
jgi:hypothetical protein